MVWSWHGPQSSDTLIASSPLNLRLTPGLLKCLGLRRNTRQRLRCLARDQRLDRWGSTVNFTSDDVTAITIIITFSKETFCHHDQVLMQLPSDPKPPVEEPMLPPEGSPTRFATPVHESLKRPSFGAFRFLPTAWNNYFRETYFRKILHLTDVHIDLAYMEGAEAACGFVFPH